MIFVPGGGMKGWSHLALNIVLVFGGALVLFLLTGWNILKENILHVAFAVYCFSNLPDIDSFNSRISRSFFIFYIAIGSFGIWSLYKHGVGAGYVTIAGLTALYHLKVAEHSSKHRKFPHSFTFGILCTLTLWHFTSLPVALIGFACFFLHILLDDHLLEALATDIRFWTGLLHGRLHIFR
jgi:hypothetical protein